MNDSYVTTTELTARRDAKAIPHLEQYATVWIVDQKIMLEEDAIQFNVLFHFNVHGWVNRRYRYDGFNDTLYHKGQTIMDEEEALELSLREPYIRALITDTPNSYGG